MLVSMITPRSRRSNALLIVAVLLTGCDDGEPAASGADTTGESTGPLFVATAPPATIIFSSNRHAPHPSSDDDAELPDFELFVVNPDGSGLIQITDGPGAVGEPRWSPDGESIAFIWTLDGTDSQVWIAARDGSNLRMLRDTEGLSFAGLSWSPDGTRLAYTDNGSIHILDLTTGTDHRLVKGSWPAWSMVGGTTVVVYTSGQFVGEGSQTDLRVIEPDGSNDRPIVLGSSSDPPNLTNASEASTETGTNRFAFVSSANGYAGEAADWDEQIYVAELIDANPVRTTTPVLISRSPTNDHWPPSWSKRASPTADGACLVWTSDNDETSQFTSGLVVATTDQADTAIIELTATGVAYDWFPDWHPNAECPITSTS